MKKSVFRIIVLLLNLGFLSLVIYLFYFDGRNIPEAKRVVNAEQLSMTLVLESVIKAAIRLISFVLLIFTMIHFIKKKKKITLIHSVILVLILLSTFADIYFPK